MATEQQVLSALKSRFCTPAYALLTSVRNQTGFQRQIRTADALAMSLYPSRGIELLGFEVKVSRADWLRELREPDKAESIARYCDRWYVVAGDKDVVEDNEVPPNWGLLTLRGSRVITDIQAADLSEDRGHKEIGRDFLAGIFRRVNDYEKGYVKKSEVDGIVRTRLDSIEENAVGRQDMRLKQQLDQAQAELANLRSSAKMFEERSGVKLDPWNSDRIGDAVKFVLAGNVDGLRKQLDGLLHSAHCIVSSIEQAIGKDQDKKETT